MPENPEDGAHVRSSRGGRPQVWFLEADLLRLRDDGVGASGDLTAVEKRQRTSRRIETTRHAGPDARTPRRGLAVLE
jgi:hypothetical protein